MQTCLLQSCIVVYLALDPSLTENFAIILLMCSCKHVYSIISDNRSRVSCSSVVSITVWEPFGQGFESSSYERLDWQNSSESLLQHLTSDQPQASACKCIGGTIHGSKVGVYNFRLIVGCQAKLDRCPYMETDVTRLAGHDTYPFVFVELLLLRAPSNHVSEVWSCVSLVELLGQWSSSKIVSELKWVWNYLAW